MKTFYLTLCCALLSLAATAQTADDFYSTEAIRKIEVAFSQDNWRDQLDSLRLMGDDLLLATVSIDGKTYPYAGVRYRARKGFEPGEARNGLHIELDYFDSEQHHMGYRTVVLSQALRDPSMVREVLGYEIAGNYMPTPRANYAQLTLGGQPAGVYINVEAVDEVFLQKHFGSEDGALFKAKDYTRYNDVPSDCQIGAQGALLHESNAACYFANFDKHSEDGWKELMELTRILKEAPEQLPQVLDIDRTLWWLAFNATTASLNSYSGRYAENFYLYQDRFGRFVPIVGDLNLAFGSYKNINTDRPLGLKALQTLDPLLHADNKDRPLIKALLSNDTYRKIYLDHIRTIVEDHFRNGDYAKRAEELQRSIQVAYSQDSNKPYEFDQFKSALDKTIGSRSKIPGIRELMGKRERYLRKHPALRTIPPVVSSVDVLRRARFSNSSVDKFSVTAVVEKRPTRVKLYYRHADDQDWQWTYMYDDGEHNDGDAGDDKYGAMVSANGSDLEYYVEAENNGGMTYEPRDYPVRRYNANLDELNQ